MWVNHYNRGYNAHEPWDKTTDVYVNHDLDDGQVELFYRVVGENYNILPKIEDFDPYKCFRLFEKDVDVWTVSYKRSYSDKSYYESVVGKDAVQRFVSRCVEQMDGVDFPITEISIVKQF